MTHSEHQRIKIYYIIYLPLHITRRSVYLIPIGAREKNIKMFYLMCLHSPRIPTYTYLPVVNLKSTGFFLFFNRNRDNVRESLDQRCARVIIIFMIISRTRKQYNIHNLMYAHTHSCIIYNICSYYYITQREYREYSYYLHTKPKGVRSSVRGRYLYAATAPAAPVYICV